MSSGINDFSQKRAYSWPIFSVLPVELSLIICHMQAVLDFRTPNLDFSYTDDEQTFRAIAQWPRGSKAWVCGRSLAGIEGSNPAGGMDVCHL